MTKAGRRSLPPGSPAAGCGVRMACSCSRSAAEASRRTSAPTWSARSSTRARVGAAIVGIVGRDGGYHRPRRRRVRDCAHRESGNGHAAQRSVPGGDLAPPRLAPEAQGGADQVGVDPLMLGPAVFLDRDGVINRAFVRDGTPHPPDEPRRPRGPSRRRQTRWSVSKRLAIALVVVTNQPDVARGRQTARDRERHARSASARCCPIDEFRVCWHDDARCVRLPETQARPADPAAALRPGPQRDRRRPLARHRGGPSGRLPGRNPRRLRL